MFTGNCDCDTGYFQNIATGFCDDIDECFEELDNCKGGKPVCVNQLGSYKCIAITGGSNYGLVYGDPHFMVASPNQPAICFDFHGFGGDIYTLVEERSINLVVNSEFTGTVKKSFMSKIAIMTERENLVLIKTDGITLQKHGVESSGIEFDQNINFVLEDLTIKVHHDNHSKHVADIIVRNGPTFRIRVHSEHLGFEIVESDMKNPRGIVGSLIQKGAYSVNKNKVYVSPKMSMSQSMRFLIPSELIRDGKCYKIQSENLKNLYQQNTTEFQVKSLFSRPNNLNPRMIISQKPK